MSRSPAFRAWLTARAERFDIECVFQNRPVRFPAADLIFMARDCFSGGLGLAAKLGKLLSQPVDHHWLIGPKSKCLGLIQIDWSSQIAQNPSGLVLDVLLIVLEPTAVVGRLFHRT